MKGLIVFHCWQDMNDPVELEVFEKIKILLSSNTAPILASVVERQDLLDHIPKGSITDKDLMREENILVLRDWIRQNKITEVYIAGLHYNHCVRQLLTRLWEVSNLMKLDWEWNFKARVIKECSAVAENDSVIRLSQYCEQNKCDLITDIEEWKTNLK